MTDELKPWDQQPGESSRAFKAFQFYRDMGPKRSLQKAMDATKDFEEGAIHTGAFVWSTKYNWVNRVIEFDRYMDRIEIEQRKEAIKEMAERHAKIAVGFLSKVIGRLKNVDVDRLTNDQLIKWFDVAAKIERLSRGESTETIKNELSGAINTGIDLSKLNDDEFDTIHALLIKATHFKASDSGSGDKTEE